MNKEFYDIYDLIKKYPKALYYIVVSARGPGKTTSALLYCIKEYIHKRNTSCLIRRWDEDIKGNAGVQIWNFINSLPIIRELTNNEYNSVYCRNRKCFLCFRDEEGNITKKDNQYFMILLSLNRAEHYKSQAFNSEEYKVGTILFDEIFPSNGTGYLYEEEIILFNLLSTIIRGNTGIKIILMGNTIGNGGDNPHLNMMKIDITSFNPGETRLYNSGKDGKTIIAVEYVDKTKYKKTQESNIYFDFENPKISQISGDNDYLTNTWEMDAYAGKPREFDKNDIKFKWYWIWHNKIYVSEIIYLDDCTFTYCHQTNHEFNGLEEKWLDCCNEIIIAPELYDPRPNWSRNGIIRPENKIHIKIKEYIDNNKMYFQNAWVASFFNSMIDYMKYI